MRSVIRLGGIILAEQDNEWLAFEAAVEGRAHGVGGPGTLLSARMSGPGEALAAGA